MTLAEDIESLYTLDMLEEAEQEIALRERQLEKTCTDIQGVELREEVIKKLLRSTENAQVRIVASLEWARLRDLKCRLVGKHDKLCRERDRLAMEYSSWRALRSCGGDS